MSTRVKTFFLAIALVISAQAALAELYVSSPTSTTLSTNSVRITASATPTSSSAITSMGLYVDGTRVYTANANTMDTVQTIATGTHQVVLSAWDAAGAVQQRTYQLTVTGTSTTANPTVTIQSPAAGAYVSSPVRLTASSVAASGTRITGMRVYVDSANVYSAYASTIDASITMASGTRQVMVRAWDAQGRYGTAQITLNVGQATAAPSISSFAASPASITAGQSSVLNWSVANASSVTINPGNLTSTSANSSVTVTPAQTTTYTLTATGSGGSATQTASVTVSAATTTAPVINSFTANPNTVAPGSPSTLSWNTTGATAIAINPGGFSSTSNTGSVTVTPNQTTAYTLTASNSGGQATRSATVTVSSTSTGNSLYVSPTGSDSSGCTSSAPCRQIRRALQLAVPGTTILVADGQYQGFTVSSQSGRSDARITIRAQGSNAQIMPTTDRSDNRWNILVSMSDWVVVDGLRSFNSTVAAVRVDQSHNVTIRNGVFGNNARWGIFTNHSNDILLENNECYGSGSEHGIYYSNSADRPTIRGNRIHDNRMAGIHMNGDLISGGGRGVAHDGVISGGLVENNIIWNNGVGGGSAINMDGTQDTIVRNNLLYNNHATGISTYRIDGGQGPRGNVIANNTIDVATDGRWAILIGQTSGPITLRNNVLYNRNTSRGGITLFTSTDVNNTSSDYNIFGGGNWAVTPNDGGTFNTLAQWQGQGKDTHSLTSTDTVLFVNPTARDYHLRTGSPAIDRGLTIPQVTRDRDGVDRPQGTTTDIGAYEYR